MIYSDILSNIKTVDQTNELGSEVDTLLDNLFKTENNAFEKTLNSISILTMQTLKEAFLKYNISFDDKTMIKEYLIGLKEQLQKLKILKLNLAFETSQNSIDNLFAWVLKNLGSGIILNINTDKSIIGGAIIEFNGRYKDLTLKKKLEEVFASKREEITRTLNS